LSGRSIIGATEETYLVVVDVLLSVNGLCGLDVLLGSHMLLDDLWGGLGADLGGLGLLGALLTVSDVNKEVEEKEFTFRKSLTP
jgi:hypothetical protein